MVIPIIAVTESSFSMILALGGFFLVLIYAYAGSDAADAIPRQYDSILQSRMRELGIFNWQELAQKSGLTRVNLRLIRQGELSKFSLIQLMHIATALDWTLEEFFPIFGRSFSVETQEIDANEIEELRHQCLRLRDELARQKFLLLDDFRRDTFEQLQALLTNYPSARKMAESNANLRAKNITGLFTSLDNLVENWGWEMIGSPWEKVSFDPQFHQPDVGDISPGESVYIRFVGYRDGETVICPAKVSRSLPSGAK